MLTRIGALLIGLLFILQPMAGLPVAQAAHFAQDTVLAVPSMPSESDPGPEERRYDAQPLMAALAQKLSTRPDVEVASFDCSAVTDIPYTECSALAALYASTNGPAWKQQGGWLATTTPCSWYGVSCANQHVTSLQLSSNLLAGSIPAAIGELTGLQSLVLHNNQLTGVIPRAVGNLVGLQTLSLYYNQLTGSIPSEIGNLVGLEYLYLYGNQLSGSLPQSIGNLTGLGYLNLSGNQLTASIPPAITNLTRLRSLALVHNQLTGSIPSEIGNLANLDSLALYGNQLTGNIPPAIGSLTRLRSLSLYGNQLTGSIPPAIGNLISLQTLDLNSNKLTGSIPPEVGNLVNLNSLSLYNNQLTGNIPLRIGDSIALRYLYLRDNQFAGSIPSTIGNLVSLEYLDLYNNQLRGDIPPTIGNLVKLRYLGLGRNRLTGSIPPEIGNSISLENLYLDENQLVGTIPAEIGRLTKLKYLHLYYNLLTGSVPSIGNLSNLRSLDLGRNQLTGTIPPELGNLTSLTRVNLCSNHLTGSIPSTIGNLINLDSLHLCGNELTGSIPSAIGNLTKLRVLQLHMNRLAGTIPPAIGNLVNLQGLDLQDNELTGTVPQSFGNLIGLSFLNVYSNYLTGDLPRELMQINLDNFGFRSTCLCEPGDSAFQDWLSGIPGLSRTQLICGVPTYAVAGTVKDSAGTGLSGVTLFGFANNTATTNASGGYTFECMPAGTHRVQPSKSGYTFSPTSRSVTVPPMQRDIDFVETGSTYVVTGVVKDSAENGIPGVTISDEAGRSTTTSGNTGGYILEGLPAGAHTLTPSKSGYTFSPPSTRVTGPPAWLGANFVGMATTYVVTGVVKDSAENGIPGVTISDEAGRSTTTSGNTGGYILEGLPAGAHTLTPAKSGYTFSPVSRGVTGPPNVLGINFTGSAPSLACDPTKQPVLLIHGWGGPYNLTDDEMCFNELYTWMKEDGYREGCNLFYATGVRDTNSRDANRTAISDSLRRVDLTVAANNPNWRGHFDIVGHSYGGLNARFYLESQLYQDDQRYKTHGIQIDNLFTLGSPHGGVIIPNELYPGAAYIGRGHVTASENPYELISTMQLLEPTMGLYNRTHSQPASVCYRLIGGDFLRQPNVPLVLWVAYAKYEATGDMGVSLRSSRNLAIDPVLGLLYSNTVEAVTSDMHGNMQSVSLPVVGQIDLSALSSYANPAATYRVLIAPYLGRSPAQCEGGLYQQAAQSSELQTQTVTGEPILVRTGTLIGEEAVTGDLRVDWSGPTVVYASWLTGDINLELRDPTGRIINPQVALDDPGLDYGKLLSPSGGMATYTISSPLVGEWSYSLSAEDNSYPIGFELYAVPNGSLVLEAAVPESTSKGSVAIIRGALLDNGAPVVGSTLQATVEREAGNLAMLPLLDNGEFPDDLANDGVYAGAYANATEAGYYRVVLTAEGTHSGNSYRRTAQEVLSVSGDDAVLGNIYQDQPIDINGDGQYEYLEIEVGLTVNSPNGLSVSGALKTSQGEFVAHAEESFSSPEGPYTSRLLFSGQAIHDKALDGPYILTDVILSNPDTLVVLDEAEDVWTTASYRSQQFGDQSCRVYLPLLLR